MIADFRPVAGVLCLGLDLGPGPTKDCPRVAGSLAFLQYGFEMGWEREEVGSVLGILA